MATDLRVGKWFTFTEGPYAGLAAVVTDRYPVQEGQFGIWYDIVGDGRVDTLEKNAVYEYFTLSTDQHMITTRTLHKANRKD